MTDDMIKFPVFGCTLWAQMREQPWVQQVDQLDFHMWVKRADLPQLRTFLQRTADESTGLRYAAQQAIYHYDERYSHDDH